MDAVCFQLEACVNSFQSAKLAAEAGADRIELCENLHAGGTTPSAGTIRQVKKQIALPVFVMIRPRGGDFCYDEAEYAIMQADILLCKRLGCEGVVLGILQKNGDVDLERCGRLVELAWPMEATFHRAFDLCPDPYKAIEDIMAAGFQYLLSSGQQPQATQGKALLQELQTRAGDRLQIIAAGGIRTQQLAELLAQTDLRYFHTGAAVPLPMAFSGHAPFALADKMIDANEIQQMKALLVAHQRKIAMQPENNAE
ncbi:MAG: copper homeostasis protein CutC [Thermoflavifilum sp.]|nr:copper homeostasis protein CutC [Thermoflavifilum sp.]